MANKCVVTGGGGFIGSYLIRALVRDGWDVTCIDNMTRGDQSRFADVADYVTLRRSDIRDADNITQACVGAEVVFHLAAVNGTENFYTQPELVLDVGLRGALSVVEACRRANVPDLVVASSAEVYQTPVVVPTDESVPLLLPDSLNPRYSYGGSKIVSELIAFNYARDHFRKVQVFRPHNVYGPNMGWKHVVPQFVLRALDCAERQDPHFAIQGDGSETRAFAYVDDVVDGILTMYARGTHREVYHIGNDEEVSIAHLARITGALVEQELIIVGGEGAAGGTPRRCPDIQKMRRLGYNPTISLEEGLRRTVSWYKANRDMTHENALM